jgi:ADP-heptose:LPS heptosyltransferase
LRAIRRAEPSAHVTFIGLPSGKWVRHRFPEYVNRWMSCGSCPGLPEAVPDWGAHQQFLAEAGAARFDLAVQLHGDGRITNPFTASLGARRWGGLRRAGADEWNPLLAQVRPGRHEIERCGDALEAVGIAFDDPRLEFPIRLRDRRELRAVLDVRPKSFAVVHPGAGRTDRCWSPSAFAAVADHLARRVDRVVLTGSASESATVAAVAAAMTARPIDLAGRTSVGALGALLAAARIVVSNDTGVAHLARAVETPSVTVFAHSDRRRWAVRGARHRAVHGRHGDWPGTDPVVACVDNVLAGAQS